MKRLSTSVIAVLFSLASLGARAESDCSTVKMADPGWSDIAATNAVARLLLEGMGYKTRVDSLAVPIIYGGLKDGLVDVFLGNWMPAQQGFHDKFVASGEVQQLARNLEGTQFTLAVPEYVWEAGVRDFADLQRFADQFARRSMASAQAHRPTCHSRTSSTRMPSTSATGSWWSPVNRPCSPRSIGRPNASGSSPSSAGHRTR